MFRVDPLYADNPTYFNMTSEITSREVKDADPETHRVAPLANDDGTYSIASVFGEVVSDTNDSFPSASAQANEFASALMPNGVDENADIVDETEPLGINASELGVLRPNDTVAAQNIAISTDEHGNYRVNLIDCGSTVIHAPEVTFGDTPPLGRAKNEFFYLQGFGGDSAYADKWLEQRFGMTFNDDGTLATDGFTFATITVDVENTGGTDEDFVGGREDLATLVVIDDEGNVSRISRTSYELACEVAAPSRADDYVGTIYSAPANSHVTCTFAYAIPSHFATDGNVYVMVSGKLFPVNA